MGSIWIEKRDRWRLREEIDGRRLTLINDLGIWKPVAERARDDYKRARKLGFVRNAESRDMITDVRAFLIAIETGSGAARGCIVPFGELCEIYLKKHGPSLKGGVSEHHKSPYYNLGVRLKKIKRSVVRENIVMSSIPSDQINMLDIRDLLSQFKTSGTRMKYLSTVSHIFTSVEEWNEDKILVPSILIPEKNAASKWRKKMKPAEKDDLPHTRVLSREEWTAFSRHLSRRAFAISDIALRRFLRLADIKHISHVSVRDGMVFGLQEKTGQPFKVPVLDNQPTKYDFTNYRKEFYAAQVAAKMDYPIDHPLHFTPRTLRRTGATWAYQETKDLVGVSRMLGHKRITTTIRYLNIDDVNLIVIAKTMDRLARAVS